MGAIFALLSSLSWGTSDFLGGRATSRHGALRVLAWSQGATLVLLWAVIGSLHLAGAVELNERHLVIAMLGGCASVTGLAMFYTALARGPMSVVPPIAATGVALPVLVGLFRGDPPGVLSLLGLALAVGGVVLSSTAPGAVEGPSGELTTDVAISDVAAPAHARRPEPTTILLALGAAVGFALVFIAIDAAAGDGPTSALAATGGVRVGSSITILIALLVSRTNPRAGVSPRTALSFVVIGILDSAANLGFAVASVLGQLEVVAVLASLYPAVTSGLAAVVLGERLGRLQLVGVLVAFAGIGLLAQG